jgi:hypothetical protein
VYDSANNTKLLKIYPINLVNDHFSLIIPFSYDGANMVQKCLKWGKHGAAPSTLCLVSTKNDPKHGRISEFHFVEVPLRCPVIKKYVRNAGSFRGDHYFRHFT